MTASRHRRPAVTHQVGRRSANAHRAIGPSAARYGASAAVRLTPSAELDVLRAQALSAQRAQ
jgi:hypothetical protein